MTKFMMRLIVVFFCALACFVKLSKGGDDKLYNLQANNYDYKDALSKAILFFEGQRSGKLPASQRVKWRGDSALTDGRPDNVRYTYTLYLHVLLYYSLHYFLLCKSF